MVNEHTLNGYCIAMEEANLTANHGCQFSFEKVEMTSGNWDEILTEHFRSPYETSFSDYEYYDKDPISLDEVEKSLNSWFNSKERLEIPFEELKDKTYVLEENMRVSRFLEMLKEFQGERKLTVYAIKDKGGRFIYCDYYLLRLDDELYTLELGTND